MAFTVHIENYQSLENVTIDVDGLTVVTGPNNTGKSAVIRAILAPFINQSGNNFIRHGKERASVTLTFLGDNPATLQWSKIGKIPTKGKYEGVLKDIKTHYEVNGVSFHEVGQSVPDQVWEVGVKPISIGTEKIWPQVARQVKDVFFLVDKPGSAIAEAVADVTRVGTLNKAHRLCDKDNRQVKSELKVRKTDLKAFEARLERYGGLPSALGRLDKLVGLHKRAVHERGELIHADELRMKLQASQKICQHLSSVDDLEPISVEKAHKAVRYSTLAYQLQIDLTQSKVNIAKYEGIENVGSELPKKTLIVKLGKASIRLTDAKVFREKLEVSRTLCNILEVINEIDSVGGSGLLEMLSNIPLCDLSVVVELKKSIAVAKQNVEVTVGDLQDLKERTKVAKDELKSFEQANPRCPTCGQFRKDIA